MKCCSAKWYALALSSYVPVNCVGKSVCLPTIGGTGIGMVKLADGKEIWNYEIGQPLTSSPAVIDGTVVIGSQDGNVYAFGAKTK